MKFLEASCGFVICHKGFKLLCICFVWTIKKLKTERISLKRISQRFVESCGFSPGTPVSTHKESWQGSLGYKEMTDPQKAF